MSGEFMTYETYLRQQVDKGCYGVAIISAEVALDIANFIEKQRERIAEADRKTEQTEYDKYREKIRPHDPHKDWFEDEPQTKVSYIKEISTTAEAYSKTVTEPQTDWKDQMWADGKE